MSALQPAKHSFHGLPSKDQYELCFPLLVLSPVKKKHPLVKKSAVRIQNGGAFSVLLLETSANAGQNNAGLSPLACLGISFFLLMSEALWNCRRDQTLLSFPHSWLPFGGAYTETVTVLAKWHHVSKFYLLSWVFLGEYFLCLPSRLQAAANLDSFHLLEWRGRHAGKWHWDLGGIQSLSYIWNSSPRQLQQNKSSPCTRLNPVFMAVQYLRFLVANTGRHQETHLL